MHRFSLVSPIILSAGSYFFSDLFLKTNQTNMLIYLKGVSNAKLQDVLDFIYYGEAIVHEEQIDEFLMTGKELGIRGLDHEFSTNKNITKKEKVSELEESNIYRYKDTKGNEISMCVYQDDSIGAEDSLEKFDFSVEATKCATVKVDANNVQSYGELDFTIEQMIEKIEGSWFCKVCRKTTATKTNIKIHAETHIEGMSHACTMCTKTFSNRPNLRNHISSFHSEEMSCRVCGKTGMNKGSYDKHKMLHNK